MKRQTRMKHAWATVANHTLTDTEIERELEGVGERDTIVEVPENVTASPSTATSNWIHDS